MAIQTATAAYVASTRELLIDNEEVTQPSEMHCWGRSSDKPSLAILLFFAVLNRGLLHMRGKTFEIVLHPSKRKINNPLVTKSSRAAIFRHLFGDKQLSYGKSSLR